VMKMKKMHLRHLKLRNFTRIQILKNLSTMQELCTCLATTKNSEVYYLINRLLCLIMTLPVSTTTTERSFSTMKIIKNKLRNKMEAEFLASTMIIYIERDIATSFSSDSIIKDFKSLKERKGALWIKVTLFFYILLLMINFMLLFHIYYCYIVLILLSWVLILNKKMM